MNFTEEQRPHWISEDQWDKLRYREQAFIIFWRRGLTDQEIKKKMFFSSVSGVKMLRKRVLEKVKDFT